MPRAKIDTLPAPAMPEAVKPTPAVADMIAFAVTQPVNLAAMVSAHHAPAALRVGMTEMNPLDFAKWMEFQAELVQAGDLSGIELSLLSQHTALLTMFAELSTKAARSGEVEKKEVFYSLALRSQSQANAVLKTLIELKQPRQAVFAKNAAVNQGDGPQQVAMGVAPASHARAREAQEMPNELNALEDASHGSTTLDAGATRPAVGKRARGEALARVNRTTNTQGKKRGVA